MACDNCTRIDSISKNDTSYTIGTISSAATKISLYIEDVTTGRIIRQVPTTGGSGEVVIDLTDPASAFYSSKHEYIAYAVLGTATSIDERETMTGDDDPTLSDTCFLFDFVQVC